MINYYVLLWIVNYKLKMLLLMWIEWIVVLYDNKNIDCMLNCEYGGWNVINMIMEWKYESDCEWGYVELENWDWKNDWNCNGGCNWECDCGWFNGIEVLIMDLINGNGMIVYWLFGCCWIVWLGNEMDCLFVWFSLVTQELCWDWYFTPKKSEGIMKCLIFIPLKRLCGDKWC